MSINRALIYLNIFMLLMYAVCYAENGGSKKEQFNINSFDEAVKEWENKECIFPDSSLYKVNDQLHWPMLGSCRLLEQNKTTNEDMDFRKELCRNFYQMSIQLCQKLQDFVNTYLDHEVLEKLAPFDQSVPEKDVCSYVSHLDKQHTQYDLMRNNSERCRRNCISPGDKGMGNICELYAYIIFQFTHKKPSKEESTLGKTTVSSIEPKAGEPKDGKITVSNPDTVIPVVKPGDSTDGKTTISITDGDDPAAITLSAPVKESDKKPNEPTPKKNDSNPTSAIQKSSPTDNVVTSEITEATTLAATDVLKELPKVAPKTTDDDTENNPVSVSVQSTSPPTVSTTTKAISQPEKVEVSLIPTANDLTTATKGDEQNDVDDEDDMFKDDKDNGINDDTDTVDPETIVAKNSDQHVASSSKEDNSLPENKGKEKSAENEKKIVSVKNKEDGKPLQDTVKVKDDSDTYSDDDENPGSGHFLAYFLTAVVICISGYVIYHNKQKILAFIIEGRNGGRGGRQRSKDVKYTQLKSNVEEVMPSLEQTATSKNFVY